jgi:hypothetical protein
MGMKLQFELAHCDGYEPTKTLRKEEVSVATGTSRHAAMRRVKHLIGWSGKRVRVQDHGGIVEMRPYNETLVCFVRFV